MAKPRERVATGLTIAQISNMTVFDLQSYTPKQQREIVSRLASAVNKRVKGFEKAGIENPATIKLAASGGKISVKGKSGEQLLSEFFRARSFLKSKITTQKGWKQFQEQIKTEAKENLSGYKDYSSNTMRHAFYLYDALKEISPSIANADKYKIADTIAAFVHDGDDDETALRKAAYDLETEYASEQRKFSEEIKGPENPLDRIPKRYGRKPRGR